MELVTPSAATDTEAASKAAVSDAPAQPAVRLGLRAYRSLRLRRHGGNRRWRRPRRPVLRDPPSRRVVLRHARRCVRLCRHERHAATRRLTRARLRRPHPAHPRMDRVPRSPTAPPWIPGQARRARGHDMGGAVAVGAPTVQPRRLHLCRAGRDGQPQHQPLLVRAQRARGDAVQHARRLGVVGDRIALRPDLPHGRRRRRPGFRAPDPGRPRPAPPPGVGGHRPHGRGHPGAGPFAQTRPRPRRPARGGITPRPVVLARRRPQRRPDGRPARRRAGRGQTLRHGARHHPVRSRRRCEVPGGAGRPLPRVDVGRLHRLHPPPDRPHGRRRCHSAGHHGGDGADIRDRLGLDSHDEHRRRVLHRGHTGQRRGARGLHLQPPGAGPHLDHGRGGRSSAYWDCSSPSTSGTAF